MIDLKIQKFVLDNIHSVGEMEQEFEKIKNKCSDLKVKEFIIDMRKLYFLKDLETMDRYAIGISGYENFKKFKLVVVIIHEYQQDFQKFAEKVAKNRGLNVIVVNTEEEAYQLFKK